MVVYGSSSWVDNPRVQEGAGNGLFDLFLSTLEWLRERAALGEGAKDAKTFQVDAKPETVRRMIWLPLVLLVFSVVALGSGIWIVRRR
jgi:hypothetical protein